MLVAICASLFLDFGVQNAGNDISDLQDFKIFWEVCPQNPLGDGPYGPLIVTATYAVLRFLNYLPQILLKSRELYSFLLSNTSQCLKQYLSSGELFVVFRY